MKELLDYIQLRHKENQVQIDAASELIELLYFQYIKPMFKSLSCSNESKIVKDLIYLSYVLDTGNFNERKIKSLFVKNLMSELGIKNSLSDVDKQKIRNNIIDKHRYFITALFVAEILNREKSKENWRYFIATLFTLITIYIALLSAFIKLFESK